MSSISSSKEQTYEYDFKGKKYKIDIQGLPSSLKLTFLEIGTEEFVLYSSALDFKNIIESNKLSFETNEQLSNCLKYLMEGKHLEIERTEEELKTIWSYFDGAPKRIEIVLKRQKLNEVSKDLAAIFISDIQNINASISEMKNDIKEIKTGIKEIKNFLFGINHEAEENQTVIQTNTENNNPNQNLRNIQNNGEIDSNFSLSKLTLEERVQDSSTVIDCISLSDGRYATSSVDINIYDPDKGYRNDFKIKNAHGNGIMIPTLCELTQQNNEIIIASGGYDHRIKIWKLFAKNYVEVTTIVAHNNIINDIKMLDEQRFASCSYDTKVKIWGIENCNLIRELSKHSNAPTNLLKIKNKEILVSAGLDSLIVFWDTSYYLHMSTMTGVAFVGIFSKDAICQLDENKIFVIGKERSVVVNINDYTILLSINDARINNGNLMRSMILLGSGDILVGNNQGMLYILDSKNNYEIKEEGRKIHEKAINCLCRIRNNLFVSGGDDQSHIVSKIS